MGLERGRAEGGGSLEILWHSRTPAHHRTITLTNTHELQPAPNNTKQPTSELEAVSLELDVIELVVVSEELAVCTTLRGAKVVQGRKCVDTTAFSAGAQQQWCSGTRTSEATLTAIICTDTPMRQILFQTQCQSASDGAAG